MQGHLRSILPQKGGVAPVDSNTTALFHFDEHAHDSVRGIKPMGHREAMLFNGTTRARIASNPSLQFSSSMTIAAWVNTSSVTTYQHVVCKGTGIWSLNIHNSKVYVKLTLDSGWKTLYSDQVLASNTWYYLVVTYQGGVLRIYIDGVLNKEALFVSTDNIKSTTDDILIGAENPPAPSSLLVGSVGEIRVWNKALSPEQVLVAMRGNPSDDGLVAYWKMDGEPTSVIYDSSSCGNDALVTGTLGKAAGNSSYAISQDAYGNLTGKAGAGLLAEDAATNLVTAPYMENHVARTTGTSSMSLDYFQIGKVVARGVTLNQGLTADIISVQIPHISVAAQMTFSIWMRSTKARPLKTQVRCKVDGVDHWLSNANVWVSGTAIEHTNILDGYTKIGEWQRVFFTFPPFPAGTVTDVRLLEGFYRTTNDFVLNLANPQLEERAYSTSFVAGSRKEASIRYDSRLLHPKEGSLSFWFRTTVNEFRSQMRLLEIGTFTADKSLPRILVAEVDGTGPTIYMIDGNGQRVSFTGQPSIIDGEWHHISFSWSSAANRAFGMLDGVVAMDGAYASTHETYPTDIYLHGIEASSRAHIIDELRMDKVARSEAEMRAWYYQGRNGW